MIICIICVLSTTGARPTEVGAERARLAAGGRVPVAGVTGPEIQIVRHTH